MFLFFFHTLSWQLSLFKTSRNVKLELNRTTSGICMPKTISWLSWLMQWYQSIIVCSEWCRLLPSKTQQNTHWLRVLFYFVRFINCWKHRVLWHYAVLFQFMLSFFFKQNNGDKCWRCSRSLHMQLFVLGIYTLINML